MSEGRWGSLNVITQNLPLYIYNLYTIGFHKNAKIYNLHKKIENLQFSSLISKLTNLHLKQSMPFKGLKGDGTVYANFCPLIYNLQAKFVFRYTHLAPAL